MLVETGSVLLLTLFASLGYVGTLIAPMFGVVGDRIGHRNLLCDDARDLRGAGRRADGAGAVRARSAPLYVFVIAALMGIVRPSDLGDARRAGRRPSCRPTS